MANYLQTIYHGVPLYYAGTLRNTIRLEPQKHKAVPFISRKVAQRVAYNLSCRSPENDFYVVP
ncbi:hypothetical protein [Bartonella sp. WD12.1]|uniref:hypothetical protein n=1 Tax=Bartonella sp. WD12.1 TaxID=1933903 RepID=UPI000999D1C0|nr:hypothetical protein [Bartonella sp. WD12.1]OPB30199.1 hypothetical protein BWD121_012530 [Bartonella sp. WD12.1]